MSQSNNREVDLGGMVLHPHKLCASHQMVDTLLILYSINIRMSKFSICSSGLGLLILQQWIRSVNSIGY